jgi:bacterioferritin-associated ferredoxin
MATNSLICTCLDLRRAELIDAIRKNSLRTVPEVEQQTRAGSLCGVCLDEILELLEAARNAE